MRPIRRLMAMTAIAALALTPIGLSGCGGASGAAMDELTKQGLEQVKLEQSGDGLRTYKFTGVKDGETCAGEVVIIGGGGSPFVEVKSMECGSEIAQQ